MSRLILKVQTPWVLLLFLCLFLWQGDAVANVAKYQMEQTAWGGSGSVLDTSGNSNNGTPVGTVSPVFVNPQISCKAASISSNTSHAVQSAINTDVDINTLGNQGSIAFWYRSNQDWNLLGASKILLDASQSNNAEFTLFHSSSQRLIFFISESDGDTALYFTNSFFSFSASDWVHIALTWDADTNDVRLYVNGNLESLSEQNGVALDEGLANIGTLYLGDNRSTSLIASNGNSADGYMDEVHLFNYELTATEVNTIRNDTSTCATPPPSAVAHYKLEESGWSGVGSVLDSSGNNNHASPTGNVNSILPSPQASCRAVEIPQNTSSQSFAIDTGLDVNTALGNSGSISFWFNSKQNWGAGDNKKLFDASTENNNVTQAHAFYATLTSSGAIEFGYETDNDLDLVRKTSNLSFNANEWVHLSFTWEVSTESMQVFVNGVSQGLTDVVNENTSNNLANVTTLYIGDNRSNYSTFFTNTNNSSDGKFDEIYLHNFVLTASQVVSVRDATVPCTDKELLLFLKLEETAWPGNGSIIDSSGNNANSSPVGSILPILPDPQIACRAANIVANTNVATINAINTQLDLDTQIGDQGSLSFWYLTDTPWNGGNNNKQLFDASSGSRSFYAALLSNGKIEFAMQDTSGNQRRIQTATTSISADTWAYLSFSWDTDNGDLRVYLDGTLLSHTDLNNDNLSGGLADFETLYIGDNRGSFVVNNSSGYSADGYIDEVRVYNYVLSPAEIAANKAEVGLCGQYAFYEFEQPSWENADSVLDSWAAMRHASSLGRVSSIFPDLQKSCLALDVPLNNTVAEVDAINTQIDMNDIGAAGTISFWYRSDQAWNGGGNRLLLDASDDSNNHRFFLRLNNDGSLRFVLNRNSGSNIGTTSSTFNFAANEWVHIAVSWDGVTNNHMQIFVNGALVQTRVNTGISGNLGSLLTLYIGDNRSGNLFSSASANGQFDNVRIYDLAQSAAEVTTDMAIVTTCSRDLAHYKFEESAWNGMNTILDSFSLSNHGTPRGNVSPVLLTNDVACQAIFIPDNSQNSVFDAADTEIDVNDEIGAYGTVSFWYQSRQNWQSAGHDKILFDASVSASQRFYLVLKSYGAVQINVSRRDGSLVTRESFTNFNFNANTWVHFAVSWDAYNDSIKMYVNGNTETVFNNNSVTLDIGLADFNSIYIGDNRGASFVSATGFSADGYFDDVRIYGYVQSQSQVSADYNNIQDCNSLNVHHYQLSFASTAGTCSSLDVNVKACADASCSSVYNNASQVDVLYQESGQSAVTFADDLAIPGNSGSGVTVPLIITEAKTVTLSIANPSPSAANNLVCSPANCQVAFSDNLVLKWEYGPSPTITTQTAQVTFPNTLKVVPDAACGNLPNNVPLEIAVECISPTTCSTAASATFNVSTTAIAKNDKDNVSSFTTVDSSFDGSSGESLLSVLFNDAGRIKLHAKVGNAIKVSNEFVVKPHRLELSYSGGTPITAGKMFAPTITARGALSGLLPNYQPGAIAFSLDNAGPEDNGLNYGRLSHGNITATEGSGFVVMATQPSFTLGQSSDFNLTYNEVGRISLDVRDTNYEGLTDPADIIEANALTIGAFIPDHFQVNVSTNFSAACNSFNYFGQNFTALSATTITFTAKSAKNSLNEAETITRYYDSSGATNSAFMFPTSSLLSDRLYKDEDGHDVTPSLETPDLVGEDNFDGQFQFVLENSGNMETFAYDKSSGPVVPLTSYTPQLELSAASLTDSTGVGRKGALGDTSYSGIVVSPLFNPAIELRYGRIALRNAFGSEEIDLPVPIQVQYYTAGGIWAVNTLDNSCTDYNSSQVTITNAGIGTPLPSVQNTVIDKGFVAGRPLYPNDGIVLDAPNRVGSATVQYTIPSKFEYLKTGSDTVSATATFGQFRGNDRIIHWREVFQ